MNESDLNKGWDISCGEEKFEVKGRKSPQTAIRLTQNEWSAAEKLKRLYTVLIFTAPDKDSLEKAKPKRIVDPANNPDSWRERVVREYILVE